VDARLVARAAGLDAPPVHFQRAGRVAVGLPGDGEAVGARVLHVGPDRDPQGQQRDREHRYRRRVAMARRRSPAALASSITATTRPWCVASSACTITCVSASRACASSNIFCSVSAPTSLPSTTILPSVVMATVMSLLPG